MRLVCILLLVAGLMGLGLEAALAQESANLPTSFTFQMTCRIEKRPLELRLEQAKQEANATPQPQAFQQQVASEQPTHQPEYQMVATNSPRLIQEEEITNSETAKEKTIVYRVYER